mgnify:CR=1 FL=1
MSDWPTGKPHISFSEVKLHSECSYRYKLTYIDNLDAYEENPYADFGTSIHNAIENYLKNYSIDLDSCLKEITNIWEDKGWDTQEFIDKITMERTSQGFKYTHENLETWLNQAKVILENFPSFMNNTFPGWTLIDAEHMLYEPIDDESISFKGSIDCVIKVPGKGNKDIYWVIDWKTTGPAGWFYKKKREFNTLSQIGMYKSYWAKKNDINIKDIRTAFVFLKRGGKPEKCIETFKVSTGPKFLEKSDKLIKNMIYNVKKGRYMKNYYGCKFCPFKQTEHCNGGW